MKGLTEELRRLTASYFGQMVEFQYRKGRKWKRVRGRYRGIWCDDEVGFNIRLNHTYYLGRYWGRMRLRFPISEIRWVTRTSISLLPAPLKQLTEGEENKL